MGEGLVCSCCCWEVKAQGKAAWDGWGGGAGL